MPEMPIIGKTTAWKISKSGKVVATSNPQAVPLGLFRVWRKLQLTGDSLASKC